MFTFKKGAAFALRVMHNRIFGVVALAVVCSMLIAAVSVNTNTVVIRDNENQEYTITTLSTNPEDILNEAQISLGYNDEFSFDGISNGFGTIFITRAVDVTVKAGRDTYLKTVAPNTSVRAVLANLGVKLDGNDTMNCDLDDTVYNRMEIVITKVETTTKTEEEEIPFETVEKESSDLYKGETEVYRSGENGVKTYYYENRVENGKIVETKLVDEEITKEPVDEIILVGTKEKTTVKKPSSNKSDSTSKTDKADKSDKTYSVNTISPLTSSKVSLDANGVPKSYSRLITGSATAYTAEDGARTASGMLAGVGYIAVDPDEIPYGTELYVVSADGRFVYGYCIAADTGGFTSGSTVADLYFDTLNECYQFGRRDICIYVL